MILYQTFLVLLLVACLSMTSLAFAPRSHPTFAMSQRIAPAQPTFVMHMSDEDESKAVESKISADGTFYDDEVCVPKRVLKDLVCVLVLTTMLLHVRL